jgi:hypothetical protein
MKKPDQVLVFIIHKNKGGLRHKIGHFLTVYCQVYIWYCLYIKSVLIQLL